MTSPILVIGGGLAGLAAATRLLERGADVLLLEARDRLGGRVHTVREGGQVIELGAEFLHGPPEEVLALLDRYGVEAEPEQPAPEGREDEFFAEIADFCAAGAAFPDDSVADLARRLRPTRGDRLWGVLGYVGGFHAADVERMSVRALIEAERVQGVGSAPPRRVLGGFDRLVDGLAAELGPERIRRSWPVSAISWSRGRVEASGPAGQVRGRAAILSWPVRLWAEDAVRLDPPLPEKRAAAAGIGVGAALRLTLRLRHPVPGPPFLELGERFGVGWLEGPLAVVWAGGPQAEALRGVAGPELAALAVAELEAALGRSLGELVLGWHHHDWQGDPWARGAYSYGLAGHPDAHARLAEPVEDTLFIAGEATCEPGAAATVHGAILSGWRAADAVPAMDSWHFR